MERAQSDVDDLAPTSRTSSAGSFCCDVSLLILETVPSPNSDAERSLKALGYRVRRTFDANTLLDCD